jgi:hypothetical protein
MESLKLPFWFTSDIALPIMALPKCVLEQWCKDRGKCIVNSDKDDSFYIRDCCKASDQHDDCCKCCTFPK